MKIIFLSALGCLLAFNQAGAQNKTKKKAGKAPAAAETKKEEAKQMTEEEKLSYSIGHSIATQLKQQQVTLNPELVAKGVKEFNANDLKTMTIDQVMQTMQDFDAKMREKMQEQSSKSGDENKAKGMAFLEENKKKASVKVTASGLQYEVIKEGTGPKPSATDKVKVHYHGTTIDGTVFDSSVDRGEPITFGLDQVIKGWTEGVQLMGVGSKYKFYIPSELAYGTRGAGGQIGPNSTLIFEVELIDIPKQ